MFIKITKKKYFSSQKIAESNDPIANAKYCDMNEKIERVSKLYYIEITKFNVPMLFLPVLFATAINYFVYDLGNDSYRLPFSILYVHTKRYLMLSNKQIN